MNSDEKHSQWTEKQVGDEIELCYGKGLIEKERINGKIPVFGSNGIVGFHNKPLVKGPGVIIGRKGSVGEVNFSFVDFWAIDTTYFVKLKKRGDIRFWYYFLLTLQLNKMNSHSAVPGLNRAAVYEITKKIPENPEQQIIADILATLDSKIDLNERMNRTLEAVGAAVFKRWFVDFEFPNTEGKPYKSTGGKMEYNEEIGREVPAGWEVTSLENVAEFTRGFSYNGTEKNLSTGEFVFITLNSIREGGGFKREFSYLTSSRLKDRHFVKEGDLVIANTHFGVGGSNEARILGTPALVEFPSNYNQQKGCFSHHITKVTPKNKEMKDYLYYHLQHFQKKATEYKIGSFIWSLDVQGFAQNEDISIPPQNLLKNFSNLIDAFFKRKQANNRQSETLSILRETLLPKLMSGKIRVPINKGNFEEAT